MMPVEGSTLKPTTNVDTKAWTNRANIVVPGVTIAPLLHVKEEDSDEEISDEAMLARHDRALMKEQRKNMAHLLHDNQEVGLTVTEDGLRVAILTSM